MGWPELCQSDVTLSDRPWKHFAHLLMSQAASQLGQTQPDLRGCYCRTPFDKRTSRRTNLFGIVIFVSLRLGLTRDPRNELASRIRERSSVPL